MKVTEFLNSEKCGSPYLKYSKNVYTQNGEDGILEKILDELNLNSGNVVEFGAWDGIYLSNVYRLWKHGNFKGILIESDETRARNFKEPNGKAKMFNYLISPEKLDVDSIDNVLDKIGIEGEIVIMSIDIDSCDYYVMESMEKYKPAIIIIETSNSYGPDEVYRSYDSGCSMRAVWDLSIKKGYKMVAYTANAILVREDLISKLNEFDPNISPSQMYINERQYLTISSCDENGIIGDIPFYLTDLYTKRISEERVKIENL
jgi:hypothetical protein